MNEESLLRLSISLDEHAPTTLDKYICYLVEDTLFRSDRNDLSAIEICQSINKEFDLLFDITEICNALKRKSKGNIIFHDEVYSLAPQKREKLKKQTDMSGILCRHIQRYAKEASKEIDQDTLYNLFTKYLYYCFNSNIKNFLSLLGENGKAPISNFGASDAEIDSINAFLQWDNEEKNKFLYSIVSFSYEYCMLTTKKDSLLSKKIFAGKKFILDSNMIFRMAGINKDERKFVITNFVAKCREVGINLFYTSETLSEIYRVISGQIDYIKYITQNQEPLDKETIEQLYYDSEVNDFYNLYYTWCRQAGNLYSDYISFQQHLFQLIRNTISELSFFDLTGKVPNNELFENSAAKLKAFKDEKRPARRTSITSAKTDISNIMYTLTLRNNTANQNLWQVNEYIVSADQLMTAWASMEYAGIPVVVIPSVWLSIILRFSGRNSDDYKSFCSFLTLRHHRSTDNDFAINPSQLLTTLARKTTDKDLKEKIVLEIIQNKSQYSFETDNDYENSITKAFDEVLSELKKENDTQFTMFKSDIEKQVDEARQAKERDILKEKSRQEAIVVALTNKQADDTVNKFSRMAFLRIVCWGMAVVVWLVAAFAFLYKIDPIFSVINSMLPQSMDTINMQWDFIKWVGILIGVIFCVVGELITYLGSDKRRKALYNKLYESNKRMIE